MGLSSLDASRAVNLAAPDSNKTQCWCGGPLAASVNPFYGKCEQCGTLVLTHTPTAEELKKYYSFQHYWYDHQQRDFGFPDIEKRAEADLHDRIPIWHGLLQQIKPEIGTLLEIGCAHGGFLNYCRARGVVTVVGVEVDEDTCRFAREHFNLPHICAGLFPAVTLPLEHFDAITSFDVLEHFLNPEAMIKHVAKLLNPGGVFLFQTPCYRGEGEDWSHFKPEEHIFLFNGVSVNQLFARAGLQVTHVLPGYFPDDMFIVGHLKDAAAPPALRIHMIPAMTTRLIEASTGTHPREGDMRWIGECGEFIVHSELLARPSLVKFELSAGDGWCYRGQRLQSVVSFGGIPIGTASFITSKERFEIAFPIEPSAEPQRFMIASSASFVPAQVDRQSQDQRRLAVKVENLRLAERLPAATETARQPVTA